MIPLIQIGMSIFFEVTGNDERKQFRSKVINMVDGKLIVDIPVDVATNKSSHFYSGTLLYASFVGKDNAVYSFNSELLEKKIENNLPCFIIKDPGVEKYVRIQRRNYVRIETSLNIALHPINDEFAPFSASTFDISGGGAGVILPRGKVIPHHGELKCWIALNMESGEIHYLSALCKIVRVYQKSSDGLEQVSLQFKTIDEVERQKIIRYCFERQIVSARQK